MKIDLLDNRKQIEKKCPNCWDCKHFAISWDPRFPYSCKLMGFKSKITPCLDVVRLDGLVCMGYEQKKFKSKVTLLKPKYKRKRKVNLNAAFFTYLNLR